MIIKMENTKCKSYNIICVFWDFKYKAHGP